MPEQLCEACGGSGLTNEAIPKVCKVCGGVGRLEAPVAVEEPQSQEEV